MYWERRIRNSDTSIESGNWGEDKKINLNKWKIITMILGGRYPSRELITWMAVGQSQRLVIFQYS